MKNYQRYIESENFVQRENHQGYIESENFGQILDFM